MKEIDDAIYELERVQDKVSSSDRGVIDNMISELERLKDKYKE